MKKKLVESKDLPFPPIPAVETRPKERVDLASERIRMVEQTEHEIEKADLEQSETATNTSHQQSENVLVTGPNFAVIHFAYFLLHYQEIKQSHGSDVFVIIRENGSVSNVGKFASVEQAYEEVITRNPGFKNEPGLLVYTGSINDDVMEKYKSQCFGNGSFSGKASPPEIISTVGEPSLHRGILINAEDGRNFGVTGLVDTGASDLIAFENPNTLPILHNLKEIVCIGCISNSSALTFVIPRVEVNLAGDPAIQCRLLIPMTLNLLHLVMRECYANAAFHQQMFQQLRDSIFHSGSMILDKYTMEQLKEWVSLPNCLDGIGYEVGMILNLETRRDAVPLIGMSVLKHYEINQLRYNPIIRAMTAKFTRIPWN